MKESILSFFFLLFSVFMISPLLAAESVELKIEGLEGDLLRNARAALSLPPGLIREGRVDRVLLDLFRREVPGKVRKALEPFGYYDAESSTALEQEDGKYILQVDVNRGEPVRISRAEVRLDGPGENQPQLRKMASSFPLQRGDILNEVLYEKAKEDLRTSALNLGFLGADYSTHAIRVNRAERKGEIDLILETGPQYRIGEVIWEGTRLYPVSFLERFLDFKRGEPYSYSKIYQTQLNLINSDRFSSVSIRAEREEAKELAVPVVIHLEPSPPKRLRPGVGYATDTGARVSLRYQDVNVLHRGHELNSDLSIAERLQGLSAYYALPSAGHIENRVLFKAGYQQAVLKPYNDRLFTLEAERARSLGYGIVGSTYLQFREEDFSASQQTGTTAFFMPGLRLNQRRVDDLLRPHKGFRYALETRGSGTFLGAGTDFVQFLGNGDILVPLVHNLFLISRLQVGATWQKDRLTDLPPTLRFYAGGDRSVRGYTYQSLGPKDSLGNVIGGKHLLVGSVELEYDFTKTWGVAAFYDAGNAFNNFGDLTLAQGAGVGIRYYTVAGPIRVDLARQIDVLNAGFQLHISVGFSL